MSGEELTAALRRSRRRPGGHLDKQVSCDSQDLAETEAALERVRFDDKVSFIEAISPDTEADKHRPSKVRGIIFTSELRAQSWSTSGMFVSLEVHVTV